MKIKHLSLKATILVASLSFMACGSADQGQTESNESTEEVSETAQSETVSVNLDASTVMWKGTMMGMYSHEGTLNLTEGNLEMTGDQITGGSFTVDMSSINPTDDNYDTEDRTPENLVGHLSSPDFFDVANNPTANFVITGNGGNTVTGNLTLRGVTNEETVENVSFDEASNTWNGTMTVDRKKYDVNFDMTVPDMVLSNDLELSINLSL